MRITLPAIVFLAVACGETEPANQPPIVARDIADHNLLFYRDSTFSLDPYFEDPDGDPLTYVARSDEPTTVMANVSGSRLRLRTERTAGSARVEVSAMDSASALVTQDFMVMVANQPPVADTIPDHILGVRTDSTIDLSLYFRDPDGDSLVYEAVTRGGTVEASVDGNLLTMTAGLRGATEVEVTATDPDDAQAMQVFVATVTNLPPVIVRYISPHRLGFQADSVIDLDSYFDDPNGDTLSYEATSTEPTVGVSVTGSMLAMSAGAVNVDGSVDVTASDPDMSSVGLSFTVTVRGSSWVENFDSAEALDGWTIELENSGEVKVTEDSLLYIRSSSDDFDSWTYARETNLVSIDSDWKFSTRQRWDDGEDLCPSVEVWTDDSRYSAWAFEIDHWLTEWYIYLKTRNGRWSIVAEGWWYEDEDYPTLGDPFDFSMRLVSDTLMVTLDADTLIRSHAKDLEDWPNQAHDPPRSASGAGFLVQNCVNPGVVTWDWAKLEAIR